MIIAVTVLSALCAVVTAAYIFYRRQVGGLCRQLRFINENKTKMELTADLSAKELNELMCEMNESIRRFNDAECEFIRRDGCIRETVANLSHDIRTPLTSLDGYFQLLNDPSLTDEKRIRYISVIKSRISSLNSILDELFTYAKLQDSNYGLAMERTGITSEVSEAALSFYEDFTVTGIEPQVDIPDEEIYISANREALSRILQNILKNALVHGSEISISLRVEGAEATFRCSNKVIGECSISPEQLFDRFYKADTARTEKGSGLGLAIAKGLTEKMNGCISADVSDGLFTVSASFPIII